MNQSALPSIGAPFEGGFYGGVVRVADQLFAIAWAPKAFGETTGYWLDSYEPVHGADSCSDSVANTLAMAEAGSPIAKWALGLLIDDHKDWVIPSRDVLELAYRHLKPGTYETACSFRDGDNPSSLPAGYPYTEATPIVQTSVAAFQKGASEAFEEAWYWSSTQYSADGAWVQNFSNGCQGHDDKKYAGRARAVRLIQLDA